MDQIRLILDEFKFDLKKIYGKRLKKLVLFGSWANGKAGADSDIDLLVVITDAGSPSREVGRMIDSITELNLKYNVLISVIPVSEAEYRHSNNPILNVIRLEGIPA